MKFKKTILALCAFLVVGAAVAGAANASWKVGPGKAPLTEETVFVSGGPWTLTSAPLGIAVKLTAEKVECTPGAICRIYGQGHSENGVTFTNVKVVNPSGCTVSSPGALTGTVSTEVLTDQLEHPDGSNPAATFDKFFPETGSTFAILVFEGAGCILNELEIPMEGVTHRRTNNTGVIASPQPIVFSEAEEKTAGSTLAMGGVPLYLTGQMYFTLNGAHAGEAFGAE